MKAIGSRQQKLFQYDAALHGMKIKDNASAKVKLDKDSKEKLDSVILKRLKNGVK